MGNMAQRLILDTDTWIEYFHDRHGIKERLSTIDFSNVYVSEISIAELYYGALHSQNVSRHLKEVYALQRNFTVIPISDVLMDYAELRQSLSSKGLSVDHFDLLIAATAIHFNLTLVTHNLRHFNRIENLKVLDWFS